MASAVRRPAGVSRRCIRIPGPLSRQLSFSVLACDCGNRYSLSIRVIGVSILLTLLISSTCLNRETLQIG